MHLVCITLLIYCRVLYLQKRRARVSFDNATTGDNSVVRYQSTIYNRHDITGPIRPHIVTFPRLCFTIAGAHSPLPGDPTV